MKNQFTFLKAGLVGLFLLVAVGVSAQVTPETPTVKYVCNGSTLELQAPAGFDNYTWFFENDGSGAPQPAPNAPYTQNYVATETGNYYVQVWNNVDGCKSDLSNAFPVYELPVLSASIASDDPNQRYCETDASTGLTLTATLTSPDPIPNGLTIEHQWFTSDDGSGTNRTPITGATSATYQVTESALGDHHYSVSVSYGVTVQGSVDGCEAESNILNITVDEKPVTPTISIVSTP